MNKRMVENMDFGCDLCFSWSLIFGNKRLLKQTEMTATDAPEKKGYYYFQGSVSADRYF